MLKIGQYTTCVTWVASQVTQQLSHQSAFSTTDTNCYKLLSYEKLSCARINDVLLPTQPKPITITCGHLHVLIAIV